MNHKRNNTLLLRKLHSITKLLSLSVLLHIQILQGAVDTAALSDKWISAPTPEILAKNISSTGLKIISSHRHKAKNAILTHSITKSQQPGDELANTFISYLEKDHKKTGLTILTNKKQTVNDVYFLQQAFQQGDSVHLKFLTISESPIHVINMSGPIQ